ncbi:MAG: GGDEF domain-containing protein [Planctomycetes bacterium]|nr:GGDEF domain-containing protein [Planctomycetota bacterium]
MVAYVLGVAVLNFLLGAALAAYRERAAAGPRPKPEPPPPQVEPPSQPPAEPEEKAEVPPSLDDVLRPLFQLDVLGCRKRLIDLLERWSDDPEQPPPEGSPADRNFLESWLTKAAAAGACIEENRDRLGELLAPAEALSELLASIQSRVEAVLACVSGGEASMQRDNVNAEIEDLQRFRDDRYHLRLAVLLEADGIESLQQDELVDPQTELHNRLGLEAVHSQWLREHAAAGSGCSVVVLDIDGFTQLNRRLGHAVGDRLLSAFGGLADDLLRKDRGFDRAARHRSDRFALFLGDTDHDNAVNAAERIRQTIEASSFMLAGEELDLTVSVGVAAGEPKEAVSDVLARAAEAALGAKSAGGNRTARYTESGPETEPPRPYQVKGRAVKLDAALAAG